MKGVASIFFGIALATATVELSAQSTGKFAVGANVSTKGAVNGDARATTGVGVLWRLGHGHEGWGWKYGMNWYSTQLDRPLAGVSQQFGEVNIKAFMGGYGYTHVMG